MSDDKSLTSIEAVTEFLCWLDHEYRSDEEDSLVESMGDPAFAASVLRDIRRAVIALNWTTRQVDALAPKVETGPDANGLSILAEPLLCHCGHHRAAHVFYEVGNVFTGCEHCACEAYEPVDPHVAQTVEQE